MSTAFVVPRLALMNLSGSKKQGQVADCKQVAKEKWPRATEWRSVARQQDVFLCEMNKETIEQEVKILHVEGW